MRLAATVILVRDASAGIDVLLLRRSGRSPFAPDAFVFPGGGVDEGDRAAVPAGWDSKRIAAEFRAVAPPELPPSEPPPSYGDATALVGAAVRELREEASITIDAASLHLFSHWITPPDEPRRYNTYFFIARAPAGQLGAADRHETHDEIWIAPGEALARGERGEMHLVYPTIKHLERLTSAASVDAVLDFARSKPIVTIMPDRAPSAGFVMPRSLEGRW
jgi:8-oxo-dGTP pyrophosphatase MutT (NUDIX family)